MSDVLCENCKFYDTNWKLPRCTRRLDTWYYPLNKIIYTICRDERSYDNIPTSSHPPMCGPSGQYYEEEHLQ